MIVKATTCFEIYYSRPHTPFMNILTRLYNENDNCITNSETVDFSKQILTAIKNDSNIEMTKKGLIYIESIEDMNIVYELINKIICELFNTCSHSHRPKSQGLQIY